MVQAVFLNFLPRLPRIPYRRGLACICLFDRACQPYRTFPAIRPRKFYIRRIDVLYQKTDFNQILPLHISANHIPYDDY